ncbi:MAG TPA: hypothetical protein VF173_09245 [Thermoanaerobaculia bacterium]|nr:hypothetical protein [Thermoanaerobaculia bacterium]
MKDAATVKVIVIDAMERRREEMGKVFGNNRLSWENGVAFDANGNTISFDGSLIVLCHITPNDMDQLKVDPLATMIKKNRAIVVHYSGNPTLAPTQDLLKDEAAEVVRRAVQEAYVLTPVEAEELQAFCIERLKQPALSTREELEPMRPEFLRRVPRFEFLQVLRVLCEGYLGAPSAAWQVVRTHQWWRQGLGSEGSELLVAFEASWPLPDPTYESARGKAAELIDLLQSAKGSIDEPLVRAVYDAVGQRLRREG